MAEHIKQKIQGGKKSICDSCTHRNVCKAIDNQPCTECNHYQCTADVIPVRHERWVKDGEVVVCSECGEEHAWDEYRATYCEDCGAKMDLEGNT